MNLIEKIKEYLKNEELVNLFMIKGYKPIVTENWFGLLNLENDKLEKISVYSNDNNRIKFEGEKWKYTLNRDNSGNLYLDHLLIGDIKNKEFELIMRQNKDKDGNTSFTIKLIDDNVRHLYEINENSIHIIKQQTIPREFIFDEDKFIEKDENNQSKDIVEEFVFHKTDEVAELEECDLTKRVTCMKEFVILEKYYPSITAYIERRVKFIGDCINKVAYQSLTKPTEDVKTYDIRRKYNH